MATHLERGTVYPSEESQTRYPLDEHPCVWCEYEHLPHLVDNSVEFYWEHQWEGSGRAVCKRFGSGGVRNAPREGTAKATYCRWALEEQGP